MITVIRKIKTLGEEFSHPYSESGLAGYADDSRQSGLLGSS